jgi:hypothetical protein
MLQGSNRWSHKSQSMRLAYLIMVHDNAEQFGQLLTAIYAPQHYYLVHVDSKSGEALRSGIDKIVAGYNNVSLMESLRVTHCGFSMVEVQLRGTQALLDLGTAWTFFINLSGKCFPLKSQQEIAQFLASNPGRNFLDWTDQTTQWRKSRLRWRCMWFEHRDSVYPVPFLLRRFPRGLKPYAGSAWFILTREICEYINSSTLAKKLSRFYKHSLCPEEAFFQTLIMNSSYASSVTNDDMRAITWPANSYRPKVYTMEDLPELLQSRALFARKFDADIDSEILEQLTHAIAARDQMSD